MKKYIPYIFVLVAFLLPLGAIAQRLHPVDSTKVDTSRFNYHVSIGTGALSGWGSTHAYTFVAPTFEYKINPKLSAFGGFAVVNDVNASLYQWSPATSYAPWRNSTRAGAAMVGGIYRPNDRLTVAAKAYYLGGQINPLWNHGAPQNLDAFGVSAAMNYKFGNNSSLSIFFDYINDRTGALAPYFMDPLYGDYYMYRNHNNPLGTILPEFYNF